MGRLVWWDIMFSQNRNALSSNPTDINGALLWYPKLAFGRTKIKKQLDLEGICMHVSSKGGFHCFCCALHLDIDIISTGIFMESS